jgi:hypothetical protein
MIATRITMSALRILASQRITVIALFMGESYR